MTILLDPLTAVEQNISLIYSKLFLPSTLISGMNFETAQKYTVACESIITVIMGFNSHDAPFVPLDRDGSCETAALTIKTYQLDREA